MGPNIGCFKARDMTGSEVRTEAVRPWWEREADRNAEAGYGVLVSVIAKTDENTHDLDFSVFFKQEYVRLARAGLLLTGSVAEAEDLAQEALARVLERWDAVGRMASPTGYLYTTLFNLNRKRLRRARAARRNLRGRTDDPDHMARTDHSLDIRRALASLPRAQREAVVLVEWLGYTAEEAAEMLRIEPVSVRGRLHRARVALRKTLGEDEP